MDKLTKLKDLLTLLQNDTITPKQVEEFLKVVLGVVKESKETNERVSQDLQDTIDKALVYLDTEHEKLLNRVSNLNETRLSKIEQKILNTLNKAEASLKEIKSITVKDGQNGKDGKDGVDGKDGKDGSPDNGEQIVDKINDLPITPENQIDASHIKNLPKGGKGGLVGGLQYLAGNGVDINGQVISVDESELSSFLKLDQTTPQTIENGMPLYESMGNTSLAEIQTAMKEPTGFPNRTHSAWTFTDGTRKLEVTVVSGSYDIWFNGVKHTILTTKEKVIDDTEGLHLVYFDTDDVLKEYVNPTASETLTAITTKCLVGLIYWDATNNVSVYVGEERHGTVMDGITHYYLHYTRGLQYVSGLGLGDFVIGDGSLDTHAQFGVETGSIADEDIGLTVSPIASTTGLPILYRDGVSGDWRTATQAGFSCLASGTATNRLYYNQLTGGAWQRTEIGEGNYVVYHVFASTGKTQQMYSIMGQKEYTTLPSARAGVQTEISALLIGNLPSVEMRPIASVIFQTDKDYGNTINARIIEVDGTGTDDYVDWRTSDLPRGTVAGDHGSLTGLGDDDHTQYVLGVGTHKLTVSDTAPSSPTINDLWYDIS